MERRSKKQLFENKDSKRLRELRKEFSELFWTMESETNVSCFDWNMANHIEILKMVAKMEEMNDEIRKIHKSFSESNRHLRQLYERISTD